ncbi:rhodanese-like domain-containing protein [Porphyromonas circumdentaria]|uniref:Rhodanese-related sulfurtransferase n=1 Tax=Porphyromonas circumdentaria TaxID=29524 RepID=A0A1T4L3H3_9PORP|nr:rhodanese-like domain-containing protein [Porphyromonas circumdentaria]MBB6275207.1 rhodanese-related sulfurtransferase [Porphyromonas circumdentaria]MDO4721837.1 rhodanese-like domain-containing protein [Porphyromonas circumdentaria]SJZ49111.1 Rhodanese-related sulfurtransferase [Porphyromonas circumdentaria]
MKRKFALLLAVIIGSFCIAFAQNSIKNLTPQEYDKAVKKDPKAVILDVRQPEEYKTGHIKGAILLNALDEQSFEKGLKQMDKTKTYYLYCRSGKRSNMAAQKMQKAGFKVMELKGGLKSWIKAEMPLEK